jgi:hypothetical protein
LWNGVLLVLLRKYCWFGVFLCFWIWVVMLNEILHVFLAKNFHMFIKLKILNAFKFCITRVL